MAKIIFHFILAICSFFSAFIHASYGIHQNDLELSKVIPLISGIPSKNILGHNQVAITLCSTLLNSGFSHTSLVFEMKHPFKDEISLFAVHYGGDGYSYAYERNLPTIDDATETLKKVYRAKRITAEGFDYVDPIYERHVVFLVKREEVIHAIRKVENEKGLSYSLIGNIFSSTSDNCCSYLSKVLVDSGIDIKFNDYFIQNATSLILACSLYKGEQKLLGYPKAYFDLWNIDEYNDSMEGLFKNALAFKVDKNYEESLKYLLETAKKGHIIAQCFIGYCYYNYDQVKEDYKAIFQYAERYRNTSETTDIAYFYYLLSDYQSYSSSQYFKKIFYRRDSKQAFKWIERSAKKGFLRAKSDCGYFYKYGIGIPVNLKKAIKLTKIAAEKDIFAAHNICREDYENKESLCGFCSDFF